MSQTSKYRNVKIPADLMNEVEKIIERLGLGYRTVSEFVIEAVRKRVEELNREVRVVE